MSNISEKQKVTTEPAKDHEPPGGHRQPDGLNNLTLPNGNSLTGEVYRAVRTSLLRIAHDTSIKSLLIVSANPGEGRTSTAIHLALTMTDIEGYRVLLVESDLRYPEIHKRLHIDPSPGLVEILQGRLSLESGLKDTSKRNLKILTAGERKSHPAELLETKRLRDVTEKAKQEFDLIIFDSPPFLFYSDANILQSAMDGVLLVVESGKTNRESVQRISSQLKNTHSTIVGVIVNKQPYSLPKEAYKRLNGRGTQKN